MLRCASNEQDQISMKSHCSKTQRYCLGKQQVVSWAYPRRMRLGLIEALALLRCKGRIGRGIRGACASASLKHRAADRLREHHPEMYPRRMRLGLIEALTYPTVGAAV